MADITLRF